jgi:hypothetical protein
MSLARQIKRLTRKNEKVAEKKLRRKVVLESLEPRLLLDALTAHWVGGSGNWSDPTNWDVGVAPNNAGENTYDVIIDRADSAPEITIDQNVAIDSLVTTEAVTIADGKSLSLTNGMTLNGTLTLASTGGSTYLYFDGSQTLSGTGEVVFGGTSTYNYIYGRGDGGSNPAKVTIGAGITIHGDKSGEIRGQYTNDTMINQGSILLDNGASIDLNGSVILDGMNFLTSQPSATINISGDLLGGTLNANQYVPQGTTCLDGSGNATSPQLLELMGKDLGAVPAGFTRNFAYSTLALGNSTYVKLVDQSDNAMGTDIESLYVNSLIVPAGTTLDLNGFHLYAQATQIEGTIVGGAVIPVLPNTAPVAANDAYATSEDTSLVVPAEAGVLDNDTDPEDDPLTANFVTLPAHGTLTFNADGSFIYLPNANFNGTDGFTYRTSDGDLNSDPATVDITVTPVNDAPLNAVPGPQVVNEDTALVLSSATGNGITLSDPDAGSNLVEVTLAATKGVLTLNGTAGLAFTTGDGAADPTMTVTGTLNAINTALEGLTFQPTPDFEGHATLTFTTNDLGNTGVGGALSDTDTVSITVNLVAKAFPVPLEAAAPDGSLIYHGVTSDFFSQSGDTDAFTINVEAGQEISLLLTPIDASIQGQVELFDPSKNLLLPEPVKALFAGAEVLVQSIPTIVSGTYTIQVKSRAGSGAYQVMAVLNSEIAVPDLPDPSTPTAGVLTIASPFNFRMYMGPNSVSSTPKGGDRLILGANVTPAGTTTTVKATQGTTVRQLSFSPQRVSPAQYVANLLYDANLTGSWAITATRGTESVGSGTPAILAPQLLPLMTDLQVVGSGLTPKLTWILPDLTGLDVEKLRVRVYDDVTNNNIFVSEQLPLSTTEYPIPQGFLAQDGQYIFAVELQDLEGVQLENSSRTFTQTPYVPVQNLDQSGIALQGSASRLAVGGLKESHDALYSFTLEAGQPATLVLTALEAADATFDLNVDLEDAGRTVLAQGLQDAENVNQAIRGFVAPTSGTYYARISGSADHLYSLVISRGAEFELEPNSSSSNAQNISLTGQVLGALGGTNSSGTDSVDYYIVNARGGDNLVITTTTPGGGDGEPVNALDPRVELYNPSGVPVWSDDNGAPDGRNVRLEYPVLVGSGGAYEIRVLPSNTQQGVGAYTLQVTGATVNHEPVTTLDTASTDEDTPIPIAASTLLANDRDVDGDSLRVTGVTNAVNGTVALDQDGNLVFTPALNFNGTASFDYTVSDGNGGTATAAVAVTVNPVNDAPVNTVPGPQTVNEDIALAFSSATGNAINISDPDAGSNPVQVSLAATNGVLSLGMTTGLSFITGDGTADPTMTVTGTLSAINTALEGLTFQPTPDFEGQATLALTTNDQGNTGGGSLSDTDTVGITVNMVPKEFPVLLEAVAPKGSLIYKGATTDVFGATGDVDKFTIQVDEGQTVSVLMTPQNASIIGRVELFDPSGTSLGWTRSPFAGRLALLQSAPIQAIGTYSLDLTALSGSGPYDLLLVLNGVLATPDLPASTPPAAGALTISSPFNYRTNEGANPLDVPSGDRLLFGATVVPGGTPTEVRATQGTEVQSLVFRPPGYVYSIPFDASLTGSWAITATRGSESAGPVMTPAVLSPQPLPLVNDLQVVGSGPSLKLTWTLPDLTGLDVENIRIQIFDKVANAFVFYSTLPLTAKEYPIPSGLLAPGGEYFFTVDIQDLEGTLLENRSRAYTQTPFVAAPNLDRLAITLQGSASRLAAGGLKEPHDALYSFTLGAGQPATLVLTTLEATGSTFDLNVDVEDTTGTILAMGLQDAENVNQAIRGFVAPASGTYYARISGSADHLYSLVITRGAEFELELNSPSASAQDISLTGQVLGALGANGSGTDSVDYYLVQANGGDNLVITTTTPGGGDGEPVNALDPRVELYDPRGLPVKSDDNSAPDGRNVTLSYQVPDGSGGAYEIRVLPSNSPEGVGAYTLQVTGATAVSGPAPRVVTTTPGDGKSLTVLPTTLTITMSEGVRVDTVQATDLNIDGGVTVTGVEVVDGRTIRFLLSIPNVEQTFNYSLPADAFHDLQGLGSLEHQGSFRIDHTGPRVVAQTPVGQFSEPLSQFAFTFSEILDPTSVSAADILSFTGPGGVSLINKITEVSAAGQNVSVRFNSQDAQGLYTLVVGPALTDEAGNLMDQDQDGILGESFDDRYTATADVQLTDLTISSASVSQASASIGESVSVSWTVTNRGVGPSQSSWSDYVYLSNDTSYDSNDRYLTSWWTWDQTPLAAGANYSRDTTVFVPWDAATGSQYLLFVTDRYASQPETDETNNTHPVPITITAPDLVVDSISAPASAPIGQMIEVSWTVHNDGGASTPNTWWYDYVVLSQDATYGNGDDRNPNYSWHFGVVNPGDSYSGGVSFTLPSDVRGDYWLFVTADQGNNVPESSYEGNNVSAGQPITITAPDLVVSSASVAEPSTSIGGSVNVSWTVTNQGMGPAQWYWSDYIYLSSDNLYDSNDWYLGGWGAGDQIPLAAGGSYNRDMPVGIPSYVPTGSQYLLFVTDAYTSQPETEETNNVKAIQIIVTAPDLVVSSASVAEASVSIGGSVDVSWTVTNQGTGPTQSYWYGYWYDSIFLSSDKVYDANDLRIRDWYTQTPLTVGESYNGDALVPIPRDVVTGSQYLLFFTDGYGWQPEMDDTNNVLVVPITITPPLLDLVVSDVSVALSGGTQPGVGIDVTWTVRNIGSEAAIGGWYDQIWLSRDETISNDDAPLTSMYETGPLSAGDAYTRVTPVTIPDSASLAGGSYFIIVQNDASDWVAESSETNNTLLSRGAPVPIPFYISPPEDVALSGQLSVINGDADSLTFNLFIPSSYGEVDLQPDGMFTYIPNLNFYGEDAFAFTISDGYAESEFAVAKIWVYGVNDPPLAVKDVYKLNEDKALVIPLRTLGMLANDTDVENNFLWLGEVVSGPANGTLTINSYSEGTFTYLPGPNFFGTDTFAYRASDYSALSNEATVEITVRPVNDAPSFVKGPDQVILEDSGLQVVAGWATGISAGAANEATQALTFLVSADNTALFAAQPAVAPEGTLTYMTAPDAFGVATVTVRLKDDGGKANGGQDTSPSQTFTITTTPLNDPPVPQNFEGNVPEDGRLLGKLAALDAEGDSLTFEVFIPTAFGVLDIQPDGSVIYAPDADFFGEDAFAFWVSDGMADPQIGFGLIAVSPMNDAPPTAKPDIYSVIEDRPMTITNPNLGFLRNDTDPDGDALSVDTTKVTQPGHGTITVNANGTFTYTPTLNFFGTDTVTYLATDGAFLSNVASVIFNVMNINDGPTAANGSFTTPEDTLHTGTFPAADVDGDALSFEILSGPIHGAVALGTAGAFTYSPVSNYFGPDSFTFRAKDGKLNSNTASILIEVVSVNDAPVGTQDTAETLEDTPLKVQAAALLENDLDVEEDLLTLTSVTNAVNGTVALDGDGNAVFTPSLNFNGQASFEYTISDGKGGTATTTVTISVTPVNDAPVLASIGDQSVNEGDPLAFILSASDPDLHANVLAFSAANLPEGATFDPDTRTFNWIPTEARGPGSYAVAFTVSDGELSDEETITVTVVEVNEVPVLAAVGNQNVGEGTLLTITLSGGDVDLPIVALSFIVTGLPEGASFDPLAGIFSWIPTETQGPGSYDVTFGLTDGLLNDSEAIQILVNEVNLAPILEVIPDQEVNEGAAVSFTASATDPDLPANTLTFSLDNGAPVGTVIDSATGLFTWNPTEADGPAIYPITVRVTDKSGLDDTQAFAVSVKEVNDAPVLASIGDQSVNEEELLSFTATATDPDLPANTLTFSLDEGKPADAAIDESTGVFTWTPTADQGPGTYPITVRVSDGGLEDFETIQVEVNEAGQVLLMATNEGEAANDPASTSLGMSVTSFSAESFTFNANDGTLDSNLSAAALTILPVSEPLADPSVTVPAQLPAPSQLVSLAGSDPQAEDGFSGVDTVGQIVPLPSGSDREILTRGVHKRLPGDEKNPVTLVGGQSEHLRIDLARKGKDFSLFGDKFSWNSKINSCSSWVRSFLDDANPDKEFGNNRKIKVVLPEEYVRSKGNGKGWKG